ncbi:putative EMP1-like protein, partial [Plasmodium gaboni]
CQKQTKFCNTTSDNDNAFRDKPSDYTKACDCTPPKKPISIPCTDNKILDAATYKQHQAKAQMEKNTVDKGGTESKLKGNINNAQFKGGKKGKDVEDGNICKLEKDKHTNDWRDYSDTDNSSGKYHQGPCSGKGKDRFVIGE